MWQTLGTRLGRLVLMAEQERKMTVVPMGRRSEETIGSTRLAEVGYALSLCEVVCNARLS